METEGPEGPWRETFEVNAHSCSPPREFIPKTSYEADEDGSRCAAWSRNGLTTQELTAQVSSQQTDQH